MKRKTPKRKTVRRAMTLPERYEEVLLLRLLVRITRRLQLLKERTNAS